ncbi:hypothetical protein Nepgr_026356 [Nepenthes gracilis]|uniref:Uncharacterized protein n=1 Tax=Nepenthes gracilis TaxID=150966 RepID=A0AAD3T6Q0_NEPGR|nr:hypothetical protein Nepgr_026356 [Nepenthes gracilis]
MADQGKSSSSSLSTWRKKPGAETEDLTDSDLAAAQQPTQLSESTGGENTCSTGGNKNTRNKNTEIKKRKDDDREQINHHEITSRKIIDRPKRSRRLRHRYIADIYKVTNPIDLINRTSCEKQV